MKQIQKTVFISYRRTNFYTALAVYQDLTKNGYDCFFDYESIESGSWEEVIFENIRYRAHFVLILSPSALERLGEKNSVMRREVELAIDEKRNIIPLMMESFDFGNSSTREALTGKLASLSSYNGLKLVPEYIFASMEKLRRFLNVELKAVRQPNLSIEAEQNAEKSQVKARKEPIVEERSLSAEQWFEKGYNNHMAKNYGEAIRCYEESLQLIPNDAVAYSNIGVALSDIQQYQKAETIYREAINIDPEYPDVYSNLGILLRTLKRYGEAEDAYRTAIRLNPKDATAYYNLGNLLSLLGRYEEAESAYMDTIKSNPKDAKAYNQLGFIKQIKENTLEAVNYYKKAVELEINEAATYNNLGLLLHEKLNNNIGAEDAYRKAIEINPRYSTAYNNLGVLLNKLERFDEAEEAYNTAIKINPKYAKAHSNLGNLLSNSSEQRYREAEQAYRKAIQLKPSYATAYNNLGTLLNRINRCDDAEDAYRKALEIDSTHVLADENLQVLLDNLETCDEIESIDRKSITPHTKNSTAQRYLGLKCEEKQDYQHAIIHYKKALALRENYGFARLSLWALLTKMGQEDEAQKHEAPLREWLSKENEYNCACFEALCKNKETALGLLEKAIQKRQSSKDWAKQDPDLENLRADARFWEIVGGEMP